MEDYEQIQEIGKGKLIMNDLTVSIGSFGSVWKIKRKAD